MFKLKTLCESSVFWLIQSVWQLVMTFLWGSIFLECTGGITLSIGHMAVIA